METFADRMRKLTVTARGDSTTFRDFKDAADIKTFFEKEVSSGAMDKMEKRAVKGYFNANIMEYDFLEYFYVTTDGEVKRTPTFEKLPGVFMHRIHKVVHDDAFQDMLKKFVTETMGGDMRVSCWYPGRNRINVVTVNWGSPQTKQPTYVKAKRDQPAPEKPNDDTTSEAAIEDITVEDATEDFSKTPKKTKKKAKQPAASAV